MPILDDVIGWIFILFFVGLFALIFTLVFVPKSRISRGVQAFWDTAAIVRFRKFFYGLFMLLFFGFIVIGAAVYYVTESGWYPREREVEVFFKAHQWVDGEIQTCYSSQLTTSKTTDAEITVISC